MEGEHSPIHDITFSSSHKIIEYARELLDNSISITIDPKLDLSKPSLLCANHFTRIETFIMPSYIYKKTGIRLRSLADKNLFNGIMGEYLTSAGVLSTDNKNRDKIICTDLIKGNISWIIYPEGFMIKNKYVTSSPEGFVLHTGDNPHTVFTGASVLALKSELARSTYRLYSKCDTKIDTTNIQEYDINTKDVSKTNIQIIPVTISYFPIRTGRNNMMDAIRSLLKIENKNNLEELEIESNLILDANMHIHLGEAINIQKYIKQIKKKSHSNNIKIANDDELIQYARNDLTTTIMENIYKNVYINFDHIFALILEKYDSLNIRITNLKSLIYLCAQKLNRDKVYKIHFMLRRDFYKLLVDEPFEMFDEALEMAIQQGILTLQNNGSYKIDKEKLANQYTFHTLRVVNTFRVILNEVMMFKDLHALVHKQVERNFKHIQQDIFDIISEQDQNRFDYCYKQHYSILKSKPKDIGAPFILINKKFTKGIVLSHGYKSSPAEIRELAEFLHTLDFNVYAVRIEGHGTDPKDLKDTVYAQWIDSFNRGFAALRQISKKLYLCGFSVGGIIAIYAATSKKHKVDGLICINTAVEINDMAFNYILPTLGIMNLWLSMINADIDYVEDVSEYPDTNYNTHYVSSMLELKKLIDKTKERLEKINAPTLIIQSDHDPVVNPKSAEIIYNQIKHNNKTLKYIQADKHIIVRSEERFIVYDLIKNFLNKNN